MNNLHRELAPISDAAWAQIEQETTRTLKRHLAGRRVVHLQEPAGIDVSAVGTWPPAQHYGSDGGHRRQATGNKGAWSNCVCRSKSTARLSTTSHVAPATQTGNRPRTPRA